MVSNEDILDWYNERFNKPGFFSKNAGPSRWIPAFQPAAMYGRVRQVTK